MNANICFLGSNFIIFNHTRRMAGMHPNGAPIKLVENVPIVYNTTANIKKSDGYNYYNFCNGGLDYGEILNHIFINPNQGRNDGIDIWENSYNHNRNTYVELYDQLTIILNSKGTKIYFTTVTPIVADLETWNHV